MNPMKPKTLHLTSNKTPLRILKRARNLLKVHAWRKGAYFRNDTEPSFCAIGAVRAASGMYNNASGICSYDSAVYDACAQASGALGLYGLGVPREFATSSVIRYNDASSRTKSEVLAMFDRAIRRLKTN